MFLGLDRALTIAVTRLTGHSISGSFCWEPWELVKLGSAVHNIFIFVYRSAPLAGTGVKAKYLTRSLLRQAQRSKAYCSVPLVLECQKDLAFTFKFYSKLVFCSWLANVLRTFSLNQRRPQCRGCVYAQSG